MTDTPYWGPEQAARLGLRTVAAEEERDRLRAECERLRDLVADRCRLICDMQGALGLGCADGHDADPVPPCARLAARARAADRLADLGDRLLACATSELTPGADLAREWALAREGVGGG
jgi:hypothetical protein